MAGRYGYSFVDRLMALLTIGLAAQAHGQTYDMTMAIFNDKLGKEVYHTEVRPLIDQSKVINVSVGFELVSIVEVNDVAQSFVCNGFMFFVWKDERVVWDPSDYGGQDVVHPLPENIWRPRVVLMNTLGERDLFGDDKAPVFVYYNGRAQWVPGSLFPTSCELDMTRYPFDVQRCFIQMAAMTLTVTEMQFNSDYFNSEVGTTFYTKHGEWEILDKYIAIFNSTATVEFSCIQIHFTLKRRPYFLLVNIVLPVIFLSFLNILVFVIPADSGEKIGYGITVLLALSVFMSIIGSMLPRSSSKIPKVTLYLFILLIISMLTVIVSIVIVYLHHLEEKEVKHQKAKERYSSAVSKVANLRRAVSVFQAPREKQDKPKTQRLSFASAATLAEQSEAPPPSHATGDNHETDNDVEMDGVKKWRPKPNKYKLIGKYIDFVAFIVFLGVWLAVTLGFMVDIST